MKLLPALILLLMVVACATEVPRTLTSFSPTNANVPVRIIKIEMDTVIDIGTGYPKPLPKGTVLKQVGVIPEGDVYQPVNITLTLEGANVHEVYLVLHNNELVGYYMPVEKAFVLQKPRLSITYSTRG